MATLALAEGGDNIVQPNASLLFVLLLFLIFVFVLNRILFKPVGQVLDRREALTDGATAEARAAARRYETQLAEYEASIRQARGESYRKLEEERNRALEERNRIIEEAKLRAAAEVERGRAEITEQAATARNALQAEARHIADRISRTVLGRTVGGGGD